MTRSINGEAIDAVLAAAVERGAVPHVAAIVADADGVFYEGGAGVRVQGESEDPVTTSTQFVKITGGDLLAQLKDADCDEILICRNTLRNEGDLFLDDTSLAQVRDALPAPLRVVPNTGEGFWRAICGMEEE